jgi:hypothetical protein
VSVDDPISALQSLNASDQRQGSPVLPFAQQFLQIVRLFSPANLDLSLNGIQAALDWLSHRNEKNRQELVDVIAEEVKRHSKDILLLLDRSEEHRRFMAEEMPGLVVDALRRAERIRAKERIRRLGRILVHAIQHGPQNGADQAEEMMRIAADITDDDVLVLKAVTEAYQHYLHLPAHAMHTLTVPDVHGFIGDSVVSICGKLQSMGLIATAEQHAIALRKGGYPSGGGFVPLERGEVFLKFIAENAG